jgi:hypothetical protein
LIVIGRGAHDGNCVETVGSDKTALAVYWAHQVADRFPDGQLYVNLRGFAPSGRTMAPAEAVRRFLDALNVPPERIPVELDAQAGLYRTQMGGKRMLVVLDNARDTAQVRPLLPGAPGCLALVTSRSQLTGLIAADAAQPINLDLLTPAEAWELLARRLGPDRLTAEPDAVEAMSFSDTRSWEATAVGATPAASSCRTAVRCQFHHGRCSVSWWDLKWREVCNWCWRARRPAGAADSGRQEKAAAHQRHRVRHRRAGKPPLISGR